MRPAFLILAALIAWCPPAEAAGVIRGTLWSSPRESRRADEARAREADRRARQPSIFDYLGTPSLRRDTAVTPARSARALADSSPSPRLRDAVISVRKVPAETERRLADRRPSRESAPPRVVIRRSTLSPRVVVIEPGAKLEVENRDRIWHRLFTITRGGLVELGAVAPGKVCTLKPPREGILNLLCALHSKEFGFLLVQPNHVYARPDSFGRFALPALPPGRYELTVWDPDRGERRRTIELRARQDAVCNLSF